jgi:hypothetical protein
MHRYNGSENKKKYCIEFPSNGITSLTNIMKTYLDVQRILVGDTQTDRQTDRHTQTDRQTGDLISLLSLLETRLKHCSIVF